MILNARRRATIRQGLRQAVPVVSLYLALECVVFLLLPDAALRLRPHGLIIVGALGMWRYAWMSLHITRSLWYQYVTFPRWRTQIDQLPEEELYPDYLYFVIASYQEQPWITQRMLQALVREAATVPCRTTLFVSTGGEAEDDVFLRVLEAHPDREAVELVFMHQSQGKRIALGHALRAACRRGDASTSLTVFMDGDTVLGPDVLRKTLPVFALFPRMGGLTTDELSLVEGARWYRKWYALRFSQRHRLMKSLSLSRRVLTLTGRFSLFRTEIATDPAFLEYLEADALDHWLYGRFSFLTGDDKSTWFHLLKNGWEMLYIPDAFVYSMESSGPDPFRMSIAKMYRWFGNMLRNNGRAIRLGPRCMGFFTWWCLVDQRLSIWTALAGPTGAILLAVFASPYYLVLYLFMAVLARLVYLTLLSFEGHLLSYYHVPQMFYTQWVGALVKVHVLFRLDRQTWGAARGGQTVHANSGAPAWLRSFAPRYLTAVSVLIFVVAMALGVGVLRIPAWPPAAMASPLPTPTWYLPDSPLPATVLEAADFGAIPDDGRPDGAAIATALAALPADGRGVVVLPAGRLELERPIHITRDDTWLVGQGPARTHLVATFPRAAGEAVIDVCGAGRVRALAQELTVPARRGARLVQTTARPEGRWRQGDVVWLGAANDESFLARLAAPDWTREHPWLRQTLAEVGAVHSGALFLAAPLSLDLPATARVEPARMVRGVRVAGFTLEHAVPGADASAARGVYANLHPAYAVDAVRFTWASDCTAEDLVLRMSGRHPVQLEQCLRVQLRRLEVDGAWNTGPGGNGYVRFARSYGCRLEESTVRNIRHLTFQWSAAENRVSQCTLEVDVNFHGGFAHDNTVEACWFALPPTHPWPPVVRTRIGAAWAPPDGLRNVVRHSV